MTGVSTNLEKYPNVFYSRAGETVQATLTASFIPYFRQNFSGQTNPCFKNDVLIPSKLIPECKKMSPA